MQRFTVERFVANEAASARRSGGFVRSEDGSLVIFGLMIFLLMLMAAGLGVDLMRYEAQRVRLQSTLDRAVLAASSMDQTLDSKTVVLDYFEKAGLGYYIDAENINVYDNGQLVTGSNADATGLTSRRVEASAEMVVGASFLRFAGIDWLAAPAHGVAEESASLTEISLVLDVSGSMDDPSASGNKKIEDLQDAAKQFVNLVLCDPSNPTQIAPCTVEADKVTVSIVPYAEQVLVGEGLLDHFDATDNFAVTQEHEYSSCVDFNGTDFTSAALPATMQRAGHIDPWPMSPANYRWDRHDPNYAWNGAMEFYGAIITCRTESWREITPMTSNAQLLRDRIDLLQGNGSTSIDLGMKWGTGLLDPSASTVVDRLIGTGYLNEDHDGRPFPYDEERVEKVIVLMTDGVNTRQYELNDGFYSGASPVFKSKHANTSDQRESVYRASDGKYFWPWLNNYMSHPQPRPYGQGSTPSCNNFNQLKDPSNWTKPSKCSWSEGPGAQATDYADLWAQHPWVWWEQFSWLPSPGSYYENATKDARLQAICDAADAAGITVFTIGYEVPQGSNAQTVMSNCASVPGNYFNANGLNLSTAFAAIAREISKLQLVN
ncbi:MAG: hypothetical protein KDK10_04445 [Maritimibacter sp.]|nr:hypothetical protein [Maritimibacter sp.]